MRLPYANVQVTHWNPGATMPLVLPVHVICNTSDEQIHNNIRVNSRNRGDWVRFEDAHEGVALLCGSGPSLADTLEEIRSRAAAGGKVFAMNGAAKFLSENGIEPDYQVMIDARPETADLVGPAKEHLFASQVSPETFARMPSARLWHLQIENIDELLPEYSRSYCLVGGAASVGNTAACLSYSMGYRNLQIFGYDSSHRDGQGHAFAQPLNNGDPCCVVNFAGKEYTCSLTMKLQAEKFMETSRALRGAGCRVEVHGSGLLPDMFNAKLEDLSEVEKYQLMWNYPEYRTLAPGEDCAGKFLEIVKPHGEVIDFGCGTGRGALKIHEAGLEVLLVDFTTNSRDPEADALPFIQWDLSEPMPFRAPFGYCTDVMEHIPPDQVESVIKNIMACVDEVFFQISLVPDAMGGLIGHPLHLSVYPKTWWSDKFESMGFRVQWSEDQGHTALFHVVKNAQQ
jgi:hypothetical protein